MMSDTLAPPVADVPRLTAIRECEGPWGGVIRRRGSIVADVVEFGDGATVVRWRGPTKSTAQYASLADCVAVHGHDGTVFEWHDIRPTAAFLHGSQNALQDACENCPFADIGGLGARAAPRLPDYVTPENAAEWARGYLRACCAMYGEDWRTCTFGWAPALTIGGAS